MWASNTRIDRLQDRMRFRNYVGRKRFVVLVFYMMSFYATSDDVDKNGRLFYRTQQVAFYPYLLGVYREISIKYHSLLFGINQILVIPLLYMLKPHSFLIQSKIFLLNFQVLLFIN